MVKVVLIGLGALGLTYAMKLRGKCDLRILVDESRLKRFKEQKTIFNGEEQEFDYILPEEKFESDLIIITTKSRNLSSAIRMIKNFISEHTCIISLINGISSEESIKQAYPYAKVLKSYFIGHSAVRNQNSVIQDGVGEIVIEHDEYIEELFNKLAINYSVPEDMDYAMWLKFTFNLFSNQLSTILDMNFGELKRNKRFKDFAKKIVTEVRFIAEKKGIKNLDKLEEDSIKSLDRMCDEGKTSMHQDILSKRPTEVDIFAGEIIRLGKEYNIKTPYNQILYDLIKIKEENNELGIHSC